MVALARSINRRNSKNSKGGFGLHRPSDHLGRVTQLARNAAPISAFNSVQRGSMRDRAGKQWLKCYVPRGAFNISTVAGVSIRSLKDSKTSDSVSTHTFNHLVVSFNGS